MNYQKIDTVDLKSGVLLISDNDVGKFLSMKEALASVEEGFALIENGDVVMPAKSYVLLPQYGGDFRSMPCYAAGFAGIKWVSVYPENIKRGYPSVIATILLSDPRTGRLLAMMDGTYITSIRTGAAGGVAVKYLARNNSSQVGIVGAGVQARMQLFAIVEVLEDITEVKVFDRCVASSLEYAHEMSTKLGIDVHAVDSIQQALKADVIVTTTPSMSPIVFKDHIKPGTHINAIGADASGKHEIDGEILKYAKIVVDDMEQACHSGEVNVPLSRSEIHVGDICATIGEVVTGKKKVRTSEQDVTIFDSTGLAVQDIVCAKKVYERALQGQLERFRIL